MPEILTDPFKQAEKEVPYKWYESDLSMYAAATATFATAQVLYAENFIQNSSVTHLVGGFIFLLGFLADNRSTSRNFHARDDAKKNNLHIPGGETSPIYQHLKTGPQFDASIIPYLAGITETLVATTDLRIAIPAFVAQGIAAISNYRGVRRIQRATEIASNKN